MKNPDTKQSPNQRATAKVTKETRIQNNKKLLSRKSGTASSSPKSLTLFPTEKVFGTM